MPHIPPLLSVAAPPEVQTVYEDFYRRMSFPSAPNFITTQGHSFAVVQGTWALVRNVLVGGLIPRWIKEMMFVAISRDRNCRYCEAAHLACCRMFGVSPGLLDSLVGDIQGMTDEKTRDLILFAIKCSRSPQQLVQADFDILGRHGMGHAEIVEAIGMSALAVYANIMADATAVEDDAMFAEVGRDTSGR
jgi:AhpD family alkylhydroperoxidase